MASGVETGLFGGRIPFIKGGAGEKVLVVFFGGNALFKRIDRAGAGRYARMVGGVVPAGYTYYVLGYEEGPPDGYSMDRIVGDFAGVMRERFGGGAAVMGVSFGGFVALRLAARHPELVGRLVLMASAGRFSAEGRRRVEGQATHLGQGDWGAMMRENAALFRRPWWNALVRARLWARRGPVGEGLNDPRAVARAYGALFSEEEMGRTAEAVGRVTAPALVVGGTADQFFDEGVFRETAGGIAGGRVALFPGETHMLPVERARAVRRVVGEFLGGVR